MNVVDGSYTKLSVESAQNLRGLGYEVWVQCLWTGREQPEPRIENLRNALAGGLLIAGYISLSPGETGAWHVKHGRAGVPDDIWAQLKLVFIDIELTGLQPSSVREAVNHLTDPSYGSKRRAIYTSYHAWVDLLGNPMSFTDCLLWNANWDNDPDIDFTRLPFGGWTLDQLVGEQWSGGDYTGGVYVDRSEFNAELFISEEVYEMDAEKEKQLTRSMTCQRWGAMIATGDNVQIEQALREMDYARVCVGLPVVPPMPDEIGPPEEK